MTVNVWLGNSIATSKSVLVSPGPNLGITSSGFSIGVGGVLLHYVGDWDAPTIVKDWNSSSDAAMNEITASASNTAAGSILFTASPGIDFEITCTVDNGAVNATSTYQQLAFGPVPSGGTFTLTIAGFTTGAITYSATPATMVSNLQTAINALSGFGVRDCIVSAGSSPGIYALDFSQGRLLGINVPAITGVWSSLTGGNAGVTVTVNQVGFAGSAGTSAVETLSFPAYGTHTGTQNTIQTISSNSINGTFAMTVGGYGTTVYLPFTAGRTLIRDALGRILGRGNVLVTGGPLYYPATNSFNPVTIEFIGTLAGLSIPVMGITTTGGQNEVQQIECIGFPATSVNYTLSYAGQTTGNINVLATNSTVQSALTGLSTIGAGNVVVTGGPLRPNGSVTTADIFQTDMGYAYGNSSGFSSGAYSASAFGVVATKLFVDLLLI